MNPARWLVAAILALSPFTAAGQTAAPVEVEAAELARRPDLIGREVVVDDRVRLFLPTPGHGYDEILVRRSDVSFLLPAGLRYSSPPSGKAIRIRGILRKDGNRVYVDVTAKPEVFADDLKRLKSAVEFLIPEDSDSRWAWASWAARRAADFHDDALKEAADALQAEALSLEQRRPASRTPEGLLALARKARERSIREPEPSALAHLGFRLRMGSARTKDEFERLAAEVLAFLPNAKSPSNADPGLKLDDYDRDTAAAYRAAASPSRAALDRRLYTDALAESFRLRSGGADARALQELSDEARSRMPDRLEIAGDLSRRALNLGTENVTSLRRNEMLKLAKTLRDDLKEPAKADALMRAWLDHQRTRLLSPTDATGRIELAEDFLTLLKDKAAAADLLREAVKIDDSVRSTTDVRFQKMGFVRAAGDWRDPNGAAVASSEDAGNGAGASDEPFLGLSPAEVKAQLGEPKRISRVATQGRVAIQWAYEGAKGTTYIDFLQRAGDAQPLVIGRYAAR